MELFEEQIGCCLEQLRLGAAVSFSRGGSKWVCCSPGSISALLSSVGEPASPMGNATVLIGDARSVLAFMVAPEPDIFELLETSGCQVPVGLDAVVGLPDELSDFFTGVSFLLPEDDFQKSLVKRFQQPLLLLPASSISLNASLYDVDSIAC